MNPHQTAPCWEQSDLGPYCLHHRLPKNISRRESRRQKLTGGKRVYIQVPTLTIISIVNTVVKK